MEREIESERRGCGRGDGDTEEEHHETQGKNEPVTKLFIKKNNIFFFYYNRLFYRKKERFRKERI